MTNLVQQQVDSDSWGNFAQRILEEGGPHPRNGNKSDQAHPPIHPTKFTRSLSVSHFKTTFKNKKVTRNQERQVGQCDRTAK